MLLTLTRWLKKQFYAGPVQAEWDNIPFDKHYYAQKEKRIRYEFWFYMHTISPLKGFIDSSTVNFVMLNEPSILNSWFGLQLTLDTSTGVPSYFLLGHLVPNEVPYHWIVDANRRMERLMKDIDQCRRLGIIAR